MVLIMVASAIAESPAPTVHWGGIAYPDQFNTLTIGGTFNRFTEFDGAETRYNSTLDDSLRIEFRHDELESALGTIGRLETNITVGAGPTGSQPTKFVQNNLVHKTLGFAARQGGTNSI